MIYSVRGLDEFIEVSPEPQVLPRCLLQTLIPGDVGDVLHLLYPIVCLQTRVNLGDVITLSITRWA